MDEMLFLLRMFNVGNAQNLVETGEVGPSATDCRTMGKGLTSDIRLSISRHRWGGRPEVTILADEWGLTVTAWPPQGDCLYREGTGAICLHLGYDGRHYVLLHRPHWTWRVRSSWSLCSPLTRFQGGMPRCQREPSSSRSRSRRRTRVTLTPATSARSSASGFPGATSKARADRPPLRRPKQEQARWTEE